MVTLSKAESLALMLLLNSMSFEGIPYTEEGREFQGLLQNVSQKIRDAVPMADSQQYEAWLRLDQPNWEVQ